MYNVNTERIHEILTYITDQILPGLSAVMSSPKEAFLEDVPAGFAAERLFHLLIEGMTDIGNLLIDGFIMRDPGGYEDIVDIMEDERVYSPEQAFVYKQIILMRKKLVMEYTMNFREQLYTMYHRSVDVIHEYPALIRDYLAKELW